MPEAAPSPLVELSEYLNAALVIEELLCMPEAASWPCEGTLGDGAARADELTAVAMRFASAAEPDEGRLGADWGEDTRRRSSSCRSERPDCTSASSLGSCGGMGGLSAGAAAGLDGTSIGSPARDFPNLASYSARLRQRRSIDGSRFWSCIFQVKGFSCRRDPGERAGTALLNLFNWAQLKLFQRQHTTPRMLVTRTAFLTTKSHLI